MIQLLTATGERQPVPSPLVLLLGDKVYHVAETDRGKLVMVRVTSAPRHDPRSDSNGRPERSDQATDLEP